MNALHASYMIKKLIEEDRNGRKIIKDRSYLCTSNTLSSKWYVNKLGADLSYQDEDKAILNFANQSIFLVKSKENQSSNFVDYYGEERFNNMRSKWNQCLRSHL